MKLRYIVPLLLGLFVSASVSAQYYARDHHRARVEHRYGQRHYPRAVNHHGYRYADHRRPVYVRSAPAYYYGGPAVYAYTPRHRHHYRERRRDRTAAVLTGAILGGILAAELAR